MGIEDSTRPLTKSEEKMSEGIAAREAAYYKNRLAELLHTLTNADEAARKEYFTNGTIPPTAGIDEPYSGWMRYVG